MKYPRHCMAASFREYSGSQDPTQACRPFTLLLLQIDRVKSVKWLPFLSGTMLVQHILQKNSKWVCCMLGQNNKSAFGNSQGKLLRKSLCPHNLNSHTHGRCGLKRQEKHLSDRYLRFEIREPFLI